MGVGATLNGEWTHSTARGVCNNGFQQGTPTPATPLNGAFGQPAWGRCGYGTRIPLMVISPWAKKNFVDHTLTDQASMLRFIEDNWLNGARIQLGASFDTIGLAPRNSPTLANACLLVFTRRPTPENTRVANCRRWVLLKGAHTASRAD